MYQRGARFFEATQDKGEIIIVDNNCTDKSPQIAKKYGARVIREEQPGYGSAVRAGLKAAQGERIIMGGLRQKLRLFKYRQDV